MRPSSSIRFLLPALAALTLTDGFAPRPGYSLASTTAQRSRLPRKPLLRANTLEEVETLSKTSDLPFYAKPAEISSKNYQEQKLSLQTTELHKQSQGDENKLVKFAGLGTWIAALSSFLLANNFLGPWPAGLLAAIPVKAFGLTHGVAGMLFGGGIILTTLIEWLATDSKNENVLQFYFDKVPTLDALVVLPALTASIVSGVGLAVDHYDTLANSPFHVVGAVWTLLAFAIWWAVTDVTSQGAALQAIQNWTPQGDAESTEVPQILKLRKVSNVVSCLFVAALYAIMILKPSPAGIL